MFAQTCGMTKLHEATSSARNVFPHISQLLWRAVDLCAYGLRNFSDQEHALSEIKRRSSSLSEDFAVTTAQAGVAASRITDLTTKAAEQITEINKYSDGSLSVLREEMSKTASDTLGVLDIIKSITKETHILSLNARVEAARSGESGAGFAVIAEEIGSLSSRTMVSAAEASKVLDLTDISNNLANTAKALEEKMLGFGSEISETFSEIQDTIVQVEKQLAEVDRYQAVLTEMIATSESSSELIRKKIDWAGSHVEDVATLCSAQQSAISVSAFEDLCRRTAVTVDPGYDRLENIKNKGVVRIAVEPEFIGLSFRREANTPLVGLDVEYAQAFAKWLGVECEFVDHPWDKLTELLYIGRNPGEEAADIVWSALPPDQGYRGLAYSETYTWLNFVLCRKPGDKSISSLQDLEGKTLGIINDPGAFVVLENAGVRWADNANKPGAKVHLANLVAFSDQGRIHDALADGLVDAFTVDLPIFYWAANNPQSRWSKRIEIVPGNIPPVPYYYTAAVACQPSSYNLLKAINRFIGEFTSSPERADIEKRWQGEIVNHTINYRDEPGDLIGEQEMGQLLEEAQIPLKKIA